MKFVALLVSLVLGCAGPAKASSASSVAGYRYSNVVDVGDVDEGPMILAYQRIADLADSGATEITLRIDSFGGSIFLGNTWIKAVEDLKKQHNIRVTCIVDGAAYSMGAVILESPVCDTRLMTKRSTILFHNGSSGAKGTAEDLRQAAAFLDALNVSMGLVVADRLGMALDAYQAKIAHADWMMAGPEAIRANVVDGYANPAEIAPPFVG